MSLITDLSKSRYCKGFQCPKILWLDHYKPEEAEAKEKHVCKIGRG